MVFDMAENYPAMLRSCREAGQARPGDWLVRNPILAERVERWVIRRADHILVVVEESRDRLIKLGVPAERITVVSNTPPLERLRALPASHDPEEEELRVVYLGMLDAESRGVGILLRALAQCRDWGLAVRATVFGDGGERIHLMAQSDALRLGGVVRFAGRVPNQDALRALRTFHVGIVPHYVDEHCSTTIPNKLFDYMAAGLASVVSDAPPLARVVREGGCGEVFRDRDAVDLARALASLKDAVRRKNLGEAGRAEIASRYHWEADAGRLRGVVEFLTAARRNRSNAVTAAHAG
jgi:glycosyltransferase involved in cell wall biosynthesis